MADDSFGKRLARGLTLGASDLIKIKSKIYQSDTLAKRIESITGEPVSADLRKILEKPDMAEQIGLQLEGALTKQAFKGVQKREEVVSGKTAELDPRITGRIEEFTKPSEEGKSRIEEIQASLPEGASVSLGDFTITGDKIDVSQKKLINEIDATVSTVKRVTSLTESVPDLGGIDFTSENLIGKVLGILPRGLEGRAREASSLYLTAGEGGGLTGLSKEDEENLRTYISNLPTIGGETYKALSGDTGRLSDFDIERGKNLTWRPDLGETKGIRDKKNKILEESVSERSKAIRQGNFTVDPKTGAILTQQVVENALKKISGLNGKSDKVETELLEDINGNRALVNKITGEIVKEFPKKASNGV